MSAGRIVSVRIGRPREHARPDWDHARSRTWTSAYLKDEVSGPVRVGRLGLDGDQQFDTAVHGGPERAVLMYGAAHYDAWRALPGLEAMGPGAFGENLAVEGFDETSVCLGDVFEAGDVRLEVSSPRGPCANISRRWNAEWLLREVAVRRWTGWYLRVLREGTLAAGATLSRVERLHPDWSVDRVLRVRLETPRDAADLAFLSTCEALSPEWRAMVVRWGAKR